MAPVADTALNHHSFTILKEGFHHRPKREWVVCMYVCICVYVCMYVCVYVCVYVCMYVGVCIHVYVGMYFQHTKINAPLLYNCS